jgi:hypothetical protein
MAGWRGDEGPTSVDIADAASAVAGFDWLVFDSRCAVDTGAALLLSGMALWLSWDPIACVRIALALSHFPPRGAILETCTSSETASMFSTPISTIFSTFSAVFSAASS